MFITTHLFLSSSNEKCVMKVLKRLQVNEDEISDFKDFFLQGNTRVPSKGESA
jgi:hypothetical protein